MERAYAWFTRVVPGLTLLAVLVIALLSPSFSATGRAWFAGYIVVVHTVALAYTVRTIYAMFWVGRAVASPIGYKADHSCIHAILVPNYKENTSTLVRTLDELANHSIARSQYDVYLAMEEAEDGAVAKGDALCKKYAQCFRFCGYTVHPQHLPGEARGKASNLSWASKQAALRYPNNYHSVVVTVMDADTLLTELHFLQLSPAVENTIFVPPIIFDRNCYEVPYLVQAADLFWCAAGISGVYSGSWIMPPTSCYSLPLSLVRSVGYWDADPGAIGEDLHMYIKCFFHCKGDLQAIPLRSAASQCNIHGGGNTPFERFVYGLNARYRQAIRHMWGSLDSGYAIRHALRLLFQRPQKLAGLDGRLLDDAKGSPMYNAQVCKIIWLFYRLYEAHFLPVHFSVLLLCSVWQQWQISEDQVVVQFYDLAAWMRIVSFLLTGVWLTLYMKYHNAALALQGRGVRISALHQLVHCIIFPVAGVIFGTVPTVVAQMCHFWTEWLTYSVSIKPLEAVVQSIAKASQKTYEVL